MKIYVKSAESNGEGEIDEKITEYDNDLEAFYVKRMKCFFFCVKI